MIDNDVVNCSVTGNIVTACGGSGIKFDSGSINCIGTGNRVTGCNRGLEMLGTSNFLLWVGNNTSGNTNNNITVGANNVIANNIGT